MLIKQVIICSYIEVCARVTGGHTLANIASATFCTWLGSIGNL